MNPFRQMARLIGVRIGIGIGGIMFALPALATFCAVAQEAQAQTRPFVSARAYPAGGGRARGWRDGPVATVGHSDPREPGLPGGHRMRETTVRHRASSRERDMATRILVPDARNSTRHGGENRPFRPSAKGVGRGSGLNEPVSDPSCHCRPRAGCQGAWQPRNKHPRGCRDRGGTRPCRASGRS